MDSSHEPAVRVTLDAIYKEVLETKSLVAPLPAVSADHETRIRLLEAFAARTKGVVAAVGAITALVGGAIGAVVGHLVK